MEERGDITDIPRALYGEGFNYLGSDRFVEDTSFLRLKQLTLNYAFPKSICNKLGITSLTCFVYRIQPVLLGLLTPVRIRK